MNRPQVWSGLFVGGLIGLLVGYVLGGFVAMVALVVGGAAWWTLLTFVVVAILAAIGWRWLWTRRSSDASGG